MSEPADYKQELSAIDSELSRTQPELRRMLNKLFNLVERMATENSSLRAEVRSLKDEVARLKGEQGKPDIRPQTPVKDISSEKERRKIKNRLKKQRKSKAKKSKIKIDRVVVVPVDKSTLPPDALFKGYQRVLLQDLLIKTDNVEFRKEVFYSPSEKKSYCAQLPDGYNGEFGPFVKSIVIALANEGAGMSQPAICSFMSSIGLCWIHEGRHYKKLTPYLSSNQALVDQFLSDFWDFYSELLDYKAAPSQTAADVLSKKFDLLFKKQTGYEMLDARIASTLAKKNELLLVLQYPEIPLHNNPAELGARAKTRSRDVSLQTKNPEGTQAKDALMTVAQTAKKLGVNAFRYFYDRVSKRYEMPSLASLIRERYAWVPNTC